MGCDIHLRVEKLDEMEVWVPAERMVPNKYYREGDDEPKEVPERFYDSRNYQLFAILADVRNGKGFAGCDTGDRLTPIAEPRGLPSDVSPEVKAESDKWSGHSHSYFTLQELLDYDWTQVATRRGWVNGPAYEEWQRCIRWNPEPREYSGGVGGGSVVHVTEPELRVKIEALRARYPEHSHAFLKAVKEQLSNTYTQVQWQQAYHDCAAPFWYSTMPRLLALATQSAYEGYDHVRIVFWFDS